MLLICWRCVAIESKCFFVGSWGDHVLQGYLQLRYFWFFGPSKRMVFASKPIHWGLNFRIGHELAIGDWQGIFSISHHLSMGIAVTKSIDFLPCRCDYWREITNGSTVFHHASVAGVVRRWQSRIRILISIQCNMLQRFLRRTSHHSEFSRAHGWAATKHPFLLRTKHTSINWVHINPTATRTVYLRKFHDK